MSQLSHFGTQFVLPALQVADALEDDPADVGPDGRPSLTAGRNGIGHAGRASSAQVRQ